MRSSRWRCASASASPSCTRCGLFEGVWSKDPVLAEGSELYARRLAQETRILREVDGILPISEALADE